MSGLHPEFCVRCGNFFPHEQVCARCVADAETLTAAAAIIRTRTSRPGGFWIRVIAKVLDQCAMRVGQADAVGQDRH